MSNLLKRLEIIRIAIDLGDEDVVVLQASRLPSEAVKLAQLLEQHEYANATAWMAEYRQNNTMLTEFIDPEVSALRLELASFENTLTALTTSKAEDSPPSKRMQMKNTCDKCVMNTKNFTASNKHNPRFSIYPMMTKPNSNRSTNRAHSNAILTVWRTSYKHKAPKNSNNYKQPIANKTLRG